METVSQEKTKTYDLRLYMEPKKEEKKTLSSSKSIQRAEVVVARGRVREQIKWVKGAKGKNSQL